MSFNNNYPNRKDWRKPYRGSKQFDESCRPHGGCPYCKGNRLYADRKYRTAADMELKEYEQSIGDR